VTKEEHQKNLKKLRDILEKEFSFYSIETEQLHFFNDKAGITFELKGEITND